ncbi:MAG: bifunctional glutamate N-acetyltransferase/amino-acid acetyltransferase ArgJ [Faecalibacterium sp.]|jgi:glutamate N-acetyltransferase/amino-acid N-acetyltransferase|nr:bifunctional glutamate N-acetyltransferase/amino-acid acetyltransferase ArgJ [Faecalibacterium sp.]
MEYTQVPGGVCAAKGFSAAGVYCGIRKNHTKSDLALIQAEVRCAAAGVFTTNKVCGAPVKVDRAHLADGYAQAIIINSGNANTCAANGVALANECCGLVAEALHLSAEDVLPASTGVIGQPMTIEPFARGIPAAAKALNSTCAGSTAAAEAIMTTDTQKKEYAVEFVLGGKRCTLGAIGKGSGMIAPNMATMLEFYTTDVAITPALLHEALAAVVPDTYNQLSVDLDTSTNDTLILMASGLAGNPPITEENEDYHVFLAALLHIAAHMCALHASDGEGASHLITCEVAHAPDKKIARAVAKSVVCSNLFKAAVFGRDANWGRILCAIGYTPGDFSIDHVCVRLASAAGEVYVCENAAYHPYSEDEAATVLAEHDILVKVDMGAGESAAKAWGCDLTYDYVKINGDYRT